MPAESVPYVIGAALIAAGVGVAKLVDAAPVWWRWFVGGGE